MSGEITSKHESEIRADERRKVAEMIWEVLKLPHNKYHTHSVDLAVIAVHLQSDAESCPLR